MEAGTQVWCRDPDDDGDEAWLLAEVLSKTPKEISLVSVHDSSMKLVRPRSKDVSKKSDDDGPTDIKYDGVQTANPPLSDDDRAEGRDDDLINLPHLHEPAILHAVHERFKHDRIYTYTGPVLIAVNPFQRLPLYTEKLLEAYRRDGLLRSQSLQPEQRLAPHVYSIADRSYRQMMRMEGAGGRAHKSQSILISGESGAGKTETTKIVMLYLTTLGSGGDSSASKKNDDESEDISTMEKVLQSNPILEAFGNGKTLRNDNSSRFGKLIELGFSRSGQLLGAKVQTYLLEKVRVGFHASGERNYHIFYQILRGCDHDRLKRYHFHEGVTGGLELANHMHYTGQGGAPQLREFTDEAGLNYTIKAMKSMGWPEEKVDKVLQISAGVIHLGQVQFESGEANGVEIAVLDDDVMNTVRYAACLLGVELEALQKALTERAVMARGETIVSPLTPAKALDARDALAKTIYGAMFLWLVEQVNECIGWKDDSEVRSSIGVLDIFGFECFAINSFEQLCINFTNEALQQQFNKFIFKMEQAEYEDEKISWGFIEFADNQDCLDLIQARPNGLLPQLDDECRLGQRGSDRNWANRLYKTFIPTGQESENGRFHATAIQKGKCMFSIRHFAGLVTYTAVTGFLEKNKDEIPLTAKAMFETAPSQLMQDVFQVQVRAAEVSDDKVKASGKPSKSKTVGTQFKEQLASLMVRVESTEPHYIRCLKPNDAAKPKLLTRKRVTEQLRYGGVLEAIRVARMGFPVRMSHTAFFKRYRILLPAMPSKELAWSVEGVPEPQKVCIRLVELLIEDGKKDTTEDKSRSAQIRKLQNQPPPINFPFADVQPGLTKIFMRKPPYDLLESHLIFYQSASATLLQTFIRGMKERRSYLLLHTATDILQRVYRGMVGRTRWWLLKEKQVSLVLTNHFRMLHYRHRYTKVKCGTILLQAQYRGFVVRRFLAARLLQTYLRKRTLQVKFLKLRHAAVELQCLLRCREAIKTLTELKREQKDVGKLKGQNVKLKEEMASLKAMLAAMAKGEASEKQNNAALKVKEDEISALEKRIAELEKQLAAEKAAVAKLEKELEKQLAAPPKVQYMQAPQPNTPHRRQRSEGHHVPPPPASPVMAAASTPKRVVEATTSRGQENASLVLNSPSAAGSAAIHAEAIAEYKDKIVKLEKELESERKSHRNADGEIIKLRAELNGVKLGEEDVQALLAPVDGKLHALPKAIVDAAEDNAELDDVKEEESSSESESETESGSSEEEEDKGGAAAGGSEPEVSGADVKSEEKNAAAATTPAKQEREFKALPPKATTPQVVKTLDKLGVNLNETPRTPKERPFFDRSPSEYFPLVRRGIAALADDSASNKEEEDVVAMGWKRDITSRKEREEALR
jgi:myosin-5